MALSSSSQDPFCPNNSVWLKHKKKWIGLSDWTLLGWTSGMAGSRDRAMPSTPTRPLSRSLHRQAMVPPTTSRLPFPSPARRERQALSSLWFQLGCAPRHMATGCGHSKGLSFILGAPVGISPSELCNQSSLPWASCQRLTGVLQAPTRAHSVPSLLQLTRILSCPS